MTNASAFRKLSLALALPAGLALAASPALAQETEQEDEAQQQQKQVQDEQEPECTVTFAPEMIQAKEARVDLKVAFSEDIGTTKEVVPEEGSGLVVTKVAKADELETGAEVAVTEDEQAEKTETETESEKAEKQAEKEAELEAAADREPQYDVAVLLNAASAEDGQWNLTFEGTDGTCTGEVVVKAEAEAEPELGEPEPPAEEQEEQDEDPPVNR